MLGNKIKQLIKESGKSTRQICIEAGFDTGAMSRIINGKNKDIKLSNAFKLADALGVDINEFRKD